MSNSEMTAPKSFSLNLNELEQFIIEKQYIKAEQGLTNLILAQLNGVLNLVPENDGRELNQEQKHVEAFQAIERFASLFTALIGDKNYQVSDDFFFAFVQNKKLISHLFMASRYKNTEHLVRILGADKKSNHSIQDVKKLMMLITPESSFELPWAQLVQALPNETMKTYLGMMFCCELTLSNLASNQLNKWATMAKGLPLLKFSAPKPLAIIGNAYFNVSTLDGSEKFEFKKWAVRNYSNFIESYLTTENKSRIQKIKAGKVCKEKVNEKNTILIVHEYYTQRHAMYRCYHSMIASLKEQYNVVGVGMKGLVDDIGKADHHHFIECDDENNFNLVVAEILDQTPDAVLYPSIGMSNLSLLLASVRLAPIQCVCPGHPSSSYLPQMDYMLLEDLGISEKNLKSILTEKPMVLESSQVKVTEVPFELAKQEVTEDTCHIAINGVIQKVSHTLIAACQKISSESSRKTIFHFFMSSAKQDIEYFAVLSTLRRLLPNSIVHPYTPEYNEYMNNLAVCEFALPTIPFGGANSNIDLVRLGIPKLYLLDENDLPGATDFYMWNQFEQLDGLCKSLDELIARAINFVNDEQSLKAAKNKIEEIDIGKFFTNDSSSEGRLLEAFSKLLA